MRRSVINDSCQSADPNDLTRITEVSQYLYSLRHKRLALTARVGVYPNHAHRRRWGSARYNWSASSILPTPLPPLSLHFFSQYFLHSQKPLENKLLKFFTIEGKEKLFFANSLRQMSPQERSKQK